MSAGRPPPRARSDSGSRMQTWPSTLTQDECKARLHAMNDDSDILGVILQRPVPPHIKGRSLASAIHPDKDVEGMNAANIGNIVYGGSDWPVYGARIRRVAQVHRADLRGLEVVIVGHSEIVGKPIALHLMEKSSPR